MECRYIYLFFSSQLCVDEKMCHDATLYMPKVDGERTQVYRLADAHGGGALSGTAEMAVDSSLICHLLNVPLRP